MSGSLPDERLIRTRVAGPHSAARPRYFLPRDDIYRRNRRLVVFDMDSTLIQVEVIDELAKRAGVGTDVGAITRGRDPRRARFRRESPAARCAVERT